MDFNDITFVNTTGAPALSPSAARRMRGHITRTNFAKRRQRKAEARKESSPSTATGKATVSNPQEPPTESNPMDQQALALLMSSAVSRAPENFAAQLLSEVWNLMSANESGGTSTNLLGNNTGALPSSKPDFIEATRSAALRYWNSPSKEGNPEKNGYGAFEIMIQNMELHQAHTDGCMGAALTMSISERLAEDDIAWNKRMLNVADVIRERSKRGMSGLPPEFSSVAIADTVNLAFGFPRICHDKVIEALHEKGTPFTSLVTMAQDLAYLRHERSLGNIEDTDETYAAWMRLHMKTKAFESHENPYVRVAAKAMELTALWSQPPHKMAEPTVVAAELKDMYAQLLDDSCFYLDMTSAIIMMGAILSAKGSATRDWYIGRLKRGTQVLEARGWDDPFRVIERAASADPGLLRAIQHVWKEAQVGPDSRIPGIP